jgi:isoquinoline 1-oxidoreductase beta subunit
LNFLSPETIRDVKSGHEQANISNFFVRIDTDETVTIIVNKSEIGQGVYTAMRILVAEALACDWKKVGVEAASVDPVCNHTEWGSIQETGGSSSMRSEWELFRKALAVVREMLLAAAAKIWKVNKKSYRTENGKIIHTSGKSLSYGEQSGITAVIPLPKQINSKNTGSFKIIGKPVKRLGNPYPDFVTEAVHVAKALGKPVKVI